MGDDLWGAASELFNKPFDWTTALLDDLASPFFDMFKPPGG